MKCLWIEAYNRPNQFRFYLKNSVREVQKEGVGCLETRTLQSCRGRVVDEACFTQVDNFIAEL